MALRSDCWVKVELIPITEVDVYPAQRISLFSSLATPPAAVVPFGAKGSAEKSDGAGDEADSPGDVRTLWVDFDEHGERYKRWRDVSKECFTPALEEKPIDGPLTALHLVKFTERQGGDPRLWLQSWMRSKRIEPGDRTAHELKVLTDCLYFAGNPTN